MDSNHRLRSTRAARTRTIPSKGGRHPASRPASRRRAGAWSMRKILVVDGDPTVRAECSETLCVGYDLTTTGDVAEARAILREDVFHVLIADADEPDGDSRFIGWAWVRLLEWRRGETSGRAEEALVGIPVRRARGARHRLLLDLGDRRHASRRGRLAARVRSSRRLGSITSTGRYRLSPNRPKPP